MPKSKTWVVKLGGAMMRAPELRLWLRACADPNGTVGCVVVPGGGGLADQVRALQAAWRFDDRTAHALAIDAMRINARVLAVLATEASLCSDPAAITHALEDGGTAIWLPPPVMVIDGVPETWAVTSDCLALHLAQSMPADALLMVKSVDGAILAGSAAGELSSQGLIDDYFPELLARGPLPTRIVTKHQHAEFAAAVRDGELFGFGVEP